MAYSTGRSRLTVGVGAGLGAWLVGTALVSATFLWLVDSSLAVEVTSAYPLAVLWMVAVALGGSSPLLTASGAGTSVLLVVAGGVAARGSNTPGPWDAVGTGLAVAAGHALGVAVVLAAVEPVGIAARNPAARTFVLAFGGFVVPAVLSVVGAVGAVHLFE